MKLFSKIRTCIPESIATPGQVYTIHYEAKYGNQDKIWHEKAIDLAYESSNSFIFDYNISQQSQQINIKITFDMSQINDEYANQQNNEVNIIETVKEDEKSDIFNTNLY